MSFRKNAEAQRQNDYQFAHGFSRDNLLSFEFMSLGNCVISIDALMNQWVTEAVATQLLGVELEELDNMITVELQETEITGDDNDRIALPVFATA